MPAIGSLTLRFGWSATVFAMLAQVYEIRGGMRVAEM